MKKSFKGSAKLMTEQKDSTIYLLGQSLPHAWIIFKERILGTLVAPASSVLERMAYPRRLLVPNASSQYNPNAPQTKALDEPMWWQVAKGK